ncbi:MAG: hypothetical protein FWE09_03960 [Treponema sp.]|nr:hypothetical protein [Treponema sp.]
MARTILALAIVLTAAALSGCGDLLSKTIPREGDRILSFSVEGQAAQATIGDDRIDLTLYLSSRAVVPHVVVSPGATLIPITGEYAQELFGMDINSLWNGLSAAQQNGRLAIHAEDLVRNAPGGFGKLALSKRINFFANIAGYLVVSGSGTARLYTVETTAPIVAFTVGPVRYMMDGEPIPGMSFLSPLPGQTEATVQVAVSGIRNEDDAGKVALDVYEAGGPYAGGLSFSGYEAGAGDFDLATETVTFTVTVSYDGTEMFPSRNEVRVSLRLPPDGYEYIGGIGGFPITTHDGLATDRAILVGEANYRAFHSFASIAAGGSRHYALIENIDYAKFSPAITTPIASSFDEPFSGTFNGQNHTISGVNITGGENMGLFGHVKGRTAWIRNLKVKGSVSGTRKVGGIVGVLDGESGVFINGVFTGGRISNCSFEGSVNAISGAQITEHFGGIAGAMIGGLIESCWFDGSVNAAGIAGEYAFGGIAGKLEDTATIWKSRMTGEVNGGSAQGVGGIAGLLEGNADRSIDSSYAIGRVSGGQYVGGIAGQSARDTSTILSTYFSGEVKGGNFVGGILGGGSRIIIVRNVFLGSGLTSDGSDVGGISGVPSSSLGVVAQNFTTIAKAENGYDGIGVDDSLVTSLHWWRTVSNANPSFWDPIDSHPWWWDTSSSRPRLSWEM